MNQFIEAAVNQAFKGMRSDEGGPFGAVIVKDGKIIAEGHNEVLKTNDPTAHAEIVVIRKAAALLGRFDLSDCEIYSTCEPCPMCFAAIHWAKMTRLYFGCSRQDAADIGFDDNYIYEVIQGKAKQLAVTVSQIEKEQCLLPFAEWQDKMDKVQY